MVHIPKWQVIAVLAVVVLGILFATPNLFSRATTESLPDWVPAEQVNLGLDLQGGSYLLMQVDIETVIQEQLDNLVDGVRLGLRQARIGYGSLGIKEGGVEFTLRDPEQLERGRTIAQGLGDDITIESGSDGAFRLSLTEEALRQRRNNVIEQSIEIIRRRIDETGTREPTIQRQGADRILIQLPGVDDPERIKDLLGKTAKLTFRFVDEAVTPGIDPVPAGSEILPASEADPAGNPVRYSVKKRVMISGEMLVDAQATFQDAQPVVSFTFDSVGAKRFADATRDNVGRVFAIVLDNEVISAPVIREAILGGQGIISGRFTVQEVQDLALLLRAGALPAPLLILEERSVGPGLGADSILAGKIASILGLIFVVIFMMIAYGLFGVIATVALAVNLILLLAALSTLQATLTLPGIAGIVLTIGMAVDANVLIFERIREEVAAGRGPVTAIDAGYRRAMTTIIDANLTTLFATILLFYFGSGPVKGFAVTLSLGIITSMFTAIMVTRLMVVGWLRRKRPQELPV